VVFCGLSEIQLSLYRLFITSPEIQALLRGKESQPLKAINLLKKLCNHPELLDLPGDLKGSDHLIPPGFSGPSDKAASGGSRSGPGTGINCGWGGKFVVLERYVIRTLCECRVYCRTYHPQIPPSY
jgi:DNA repair and recombination RAD54-like protein